VICTVEPFVDVQFNYSRTSYLSSGLSTMEPLVYAPFYLQ
jgi:hypothetical protein